MISIPAAATRRLPSRCESQPPATAPIGTPTRSLRSTRAAPDWEYRVDGGAGEHGDVEERRHQSRPDGEVGQQRPIRAWRTQFTRCDQRGAGSAAGSRTAASCPTSWSQTVCPNIVGIHLA